MSNESKQLAAKAKGIDAKQVGNALLNNAPVSYTHLTLPTN